MASREDRVFALVVGGGDMGSHPHCGAFSALHLLRSYNHLLSQPVDPVAAAAGVAGYQPLPPSAAEAACCREAALVDPAAAVVPFGLPPPGLVPHGLLGALQPYPPLLPLIHDHAACGLLARMPGSGKRPRGEKRPIPDAQKDEKYFERRKRNNQAAKKSRDARKIREDQIAMRAAFLEQENSFLRTQVLTLREESQALRHLLLQGKVDARPPRPRSEDLGVEAATRGLGPRALAAADGDHRFHR
ncbi:CCAAT/enhancer-binding protein beta-like [Bacillus rossius redtenbacheri]|uniref:CCAAT/enhancer-binding protein beta-like n=1 Tax=Bacillus rossius redtenbacheri TaxID=93214 RepID=UPI002FDD316C